MGSFTVSRTCQLPLEKILERFAADTDSLLHGDKDAGSSELTIPMRMKLGPIGVAGEVRPVVGVMTNDRNGARLPVSWEPSSAQPMIPGVKGDLTLFALSSTQTDVGYTGDVVARRGPLAGVDRLIGSRVARASIGDLLERTVARLEGDEPTSAE